MLKMPTNEHSRAAIRLHFFMGLAIMTKVAKNNHYMSKIPDIEIM